MTAQTQRILQSLFAGDSLDNIPDEQLQQLVEEYPYFSLGHYLLAKKMKDKGDGVYEHQLQKTALYFHEPIWLQSLLAGEAEMSLPAVKEDLPAIENHETAVEIESIPPEQFSGNLMDVEMEAEGHSQPIAEITQPELSPVQTEPENYPSAQIEQIENVEPGIVAADLNSAETEQSTSTVPEARDENAMRSVSIEEPPKDNAGAFEPYHTIDYFASQGIRISHELQPGDRLGQQLRSFTEWLKTLKRLPEAQLEEQLDKTADQNIREIADHSLDEKEVVTETMAEVLAKQDRRGEAVAIYEKLSLLNPSKRGYFAAKIEQLKES